MEIRAPTAGEISRSIGDFFGLPPFLRADAAHLAVSAAILAVIFVGAYLLAGKLCGWLERVMAPKDSAVSHKFFAVTNHLGVAAAALVAAAVLILVARGYTWPPYSHLLFDLSIPLAAAIAAWRLASAVKLSSSARWAVAIVFGFEVLTDRFEQLGWVEASLDQIAISLGEARISILDLLRVGLVGVILYALVKVANRGTRAFIRRRTNLDLTQILLAEKMAAAGIVLIAIFFAIAMLGIDTTALSIFSGTIGLGLGFGLQKIFSNLVSGIILLMDRSIKPGDVIVVADSVGKVNRIGTRAVSMITRDGKEHLIPNELLMTERVENWNFSSHDVRIRMTIRVAYDSDTDLVEELLQDAAAESPRVLNEPAPVSWITELGEAGINYELRFWIHDPEDGIGNIQGEIYKRIVNKFRENHIITPKPGREIEITKFPAISMKSVADG